MKKVLLLFTLLAIISCSQDELETSNTNKNANLSYQDDSNLGKYKGIFTTNDGLQRATVEIKLVPQGKSTATLIFPDGKTTTLNAEVENTSSPELNEIHFSSKFGSFDFSVSNNGKDALIENAIFKNSESQILVAKETSKAPLATFTGTYLCPTCSNTSPKTFNVMVSGDGTGNQSYTTQMVYNGVSYAGIGVQNNCTGAGPLTFCGAQSGDGSTTDVGFSVGPSEVKWQAEMIYSNFGTNCSELSGAWIFREGLPGQKTGTFRSDAVTNCLTELVFEDFEDAVVSYTTSIAEYSDGFYDYFTRTDLSNVGSGVQFANLIGAGIFAAQDVDSEGASLPAYVTFSDLNVASLDAIYFSAMFAEDDDGSNQDWDSTDNVYVEYSFDGVTWVPFFGIANDGSTFNTAPLIDTDLDGVGDGAEITNVFTPYAGVFLNNGLTNPTGSSSVSIRFSVNLNSGDEDIAFDNVLIRGL